MLRDRARNPNGDSFLGETADLNGKGASHFAPCPRTYEPLVENGVVYKVASNQHERAGAFRLVHDAYVDAGLIPRNVLQMRVMPQHLLPTTAVFVASNNQRVIATMTLVVDGELGLPMESVYAHEVCAMRQRSRLGEVSALASVPAATAAANLDVVVGLMRLMAQFARRHGVDHLLVAVHPRHARFYRRCFGFKPFGSEKSYPSVGNRLAVALRLDLSWPEADPPLHDKNYELFFGKQIADMHLGFSPISTAEMHFFASAVDNEPLPSGVLACA
ncbi:MAG TPA: hypothetical protein VG826_32205 [Pirellulales bacterium]|nr:hypothetical protein [Pirellulales bacterium]